MKIRNGFVSNSSSCSFIISFPKDNFIPLKNIEEWLGGYNKKMPPEIMDIIGFQFWKTQYFDNEGCRRNFDSDGEEYIHHKCDETWDEKKEIWGCPHYEDWNSDICSHCKHNITEKRIHRGDDYYEVLDYTPNKNILEWLKRHKNDKIIYFDVDDNEPPYGVPYEIADAITSNAPMLFGQTDNVICLGGK